MAWLDKFRRRTLQPSIAIFMHDGIKWHAAAFDFVAEDCKCRATRMVGGADYKILPPELAVWAVAQQCRRARVFIPSEVHEVELRLPPDASPGEVQTALAYELAPGLKASPTTLRVAAVRADVYRMGGDPALLLAAAFDTRLIERYEAVCRSAGLCFEGVGALEMAALARHARVAGERGFLLIRHRAIFAAGPAQNGDRFFVRNIPFGLPLADEEADTWRQRLAARLPRFRCLAAHIVTSHEAPTEAASLMAEALGCAVAETAQMDQTAALVMRHAAWANVGVIDNGCASVAKPKPARDWRRVASWLALLIPLIVLAFCATWEARLKRARAEDATRCAAWQGAQEEMRRLQQEMAKEQRLAALLADDRRLDATTLAVLSALPQVVGRHSRLHVLRQEDSGLTLEGETRAPRDLPRLRQSLAQAVAPFGWRVKENALRSGGVDIWLFSYRLSAGE